MEKNNSFIPPSMMTKYKNGECRFVGYDLKEGDKVVVEQTISGKVQEKIVDKIIEQRPSLGEWKTERAISYRISVKD